MAADIDASQFNVNWLDRLLMSVAPGWGLRRIKAKATVQLVARHYEAAQIGRRTSGWQRRSTDANAAVQSSLSSLRELSRDLRRNNGWARRGVRTIINNVVGRGIQAKSVDGRSVARQDRQLEIWNAWANNVRCDYDGRMPFAGLQRLAMETIIESGEVLIVRVPATSADGLSVPIRLRVLEPDYLDTNRDGVEGSDGSVTIQGIKLDGMGRRVGYWLFDRHPGSVGLIGSGLGFSSQLVPAEDVLHVYQVERPGQLRGVPWLAASIGSLHDFDDYEDAILMQQKVAACFGAFVSDMDGTAAGLGVPDADEPDLLETLEPGQIQYLPPGRDVKFATPPATSGQDQFSTNQLRRVSATLGVTYEDLSGDYSKVNFSSARMGRLAHWQNVFDWRTNMLIPQMLDPVWIWVMGLAAELFQFPAVPGVIWTAPPMPILEPEKEGRAFNALVRSGARTLPEAIRERGHDPMTHLREIAESNKRLDEMEIILDSDPRLVNGSGGLQGAATGAADEPVEDVDDADEVVDVPQDDADDEQDDDADTAAA